MINCALIGKGHWGSKLKGYIDVNRGFNLKYLCDSSSDLEEVWRDKEVRATIVATPNETHFSLVKLALLNGKNVLSEKPLTLETKQANELKSIVLEKGLKLLTEYTYTFSKGVKKAKGLVKKGKIGKVLSFDLSVRRLGRFGGGSVYWLLGSHLLAVLDMFVPLKNLTFKKQDLVIHKKEVETGAISFKGNGVTGQLFVSLNYPGKETRMIIYGDRGTVIYNPVIQPSLQVETYERLPWVVGSELPRKRKAYEIDEANNLKYAIEHFAKVINGKARDNVDRAIQVTKVIEGL